MANVPFTIDDKFLRDARNKALRYAQKHFSGWATDDECEDMVQDALMAMFRKVHEGTLTELTSSLPTLVIGFLKNTAKKRLSNLPPIAAALPSEQSEEDAADPIDIAIAREAVDRWHDKGGDEEHSKLLEEMRRLVEDMAEPCKTILWAYYWDGKSMKEIAATMNYNNANVAKTQKHKCMTKVKTAMADIYKQLRT